MWKNRFRIEFYLNKPSSNYYDNEIQIRNLSSDQFILTNWEVLYRSGFWPFAKEQIVARRHYLDNDIIITPKTTYIIPCSDQDYHFSTEQELLKGRSIFLRLNIAGHGKICRKIYS